MQKKLILASAAMALALAAVTPVIAQSTAPADPAPQTQEAGNPPPAGLGPNGGPGGPRGPHGKMRGPQSAEIRLDFGGGRRVAIDCGETQIDACITASMPLIEKVAATEPVPFPPHGPMGDHDRDRDGKKRP